jgi:hypothetical protein
MAFTIYNIT